MLKITSQYLNTIQIEHLKLFVQFCCERLGILDTNVLIHVSVRKKIPLNWYGYCDDERLESEGIISIRVKHLPQNEYQMYKVVAHELTHAKQFIEGRLKSAHNAFYWMGDDTSHIPYHLLPQEVEANTMADILYLDWKENIKDICV